MARERVFRFKRFKVVHEQSAMKVGVDSVLLGAWASVDGARRILDAGTGCGLLALMAAQRNPGALITGVELDPVAAREAASNFSSSPWAERLECVEEDFLRFVNGCLQGTEFDLVISNPPYFDSGVEVSDPRTMARHQAGLSPAMIFKSASKVLAPCGHIAMVLPSGDVFEDASKEADNAGFHLMRICRVRGRIGLEAKRVLAEWGPAYAETVFEPDLLLEEEPGKPTDRHRELCRDFYLKY